MEPDKQRDTVLQGEGGFVTISAASHTLYVEAAVLPPLSVQMW